MIRVMKTTSHKNLKNKYLSCLFNLLKQDEKYSDLVDWNSWSVEVGVKGGGGGGYDGV